jgi:hypothetical protein
MSKAMSRDPIYRRRRFQPEIIELCVRWHLTYRLSYGDLVEMMAERGIVISHSTILWVHSYVPEFERRWSRYAAACIRPGGWTRSADGMRSSWTSRNDCAARNAERKAATFARLKCKNRVGCRRRVVAWVNLIFYRLV